jgi:hypothetical protein
MRKLGSDTMVNAFACNFKVGGVVNKDVVEANFLNARIYQRLSVQTVKDDLKDRPIVILRTELKQADYLGALDKFKSRIGLSGSDNLVVLSNVSMCVGCGWLRTTDWVYLLICITVGAPSPRPASFWPRLRTDLERSRKRRSRFVNLALLRSELSDGNICFRHRTA